ncbi:MAG: site-2 protease family protein [Nitrospirae bacterium]|nr:site-2 protease family protein [Nitrospirota bacterium]
MFDLAETIRHVALLAIPILAAVTFHEYAHAWTANRLGDATARLQGRLTLHPLKHLDPIGTLVFIFTGMIGWAKPVPVNPRYFQYPRQDMLWVALAGPGANLVLAVLSAMLYHLLVSMGIAPSEGLAVLGPITKMLKISVILNLAFAFFNILPVPPLDGSRVLSGLLNARQAAVYERIEPYGFLLLLVLVFSNVTGVILFPLVNGIGRLLLGF